MGKTGRQRRLFPLPTTSSIESDGTVFRTVLTTLTEMIRALGRRASYGAPKGHLPRTAF